MNIHYVIYNIYIADMYKLLFIQQLKSTMQEEEMEEAGFTIKASQRWDGLKGPTIYHSPHLSIKKQSLEETQGSKS